MPVAEFKPFARAKKSSRVLEHSVEAQRAPWTAEIRWRFAESRLSADSAAGGFAFTRHAFAAYVAQVRSIKSKRSTSAAVITGDGYAMVHQYFTHTLH